MRSEGLSEVRALIKEEMAEGEAPESHALGGFPGRREELGHWDLVIGPAGTSKTLGRTQIRECGQASSLPVLMVEAGATVTFLPHEEASTCTPHPKCLSPPSSLELGAKACLFMAKLEVSSAQDSISDERGCPRCPAISRLCYSFCIPVPKS